ncbi:MAG: DNA translocase FtsK 4TM domain-containing protein [Myxococcales bacterium]|nr:DNA translocase FtsK 4TM domain-containing protein [Myxococcales bacterium]
MRASTTNPTSIDDPALPRRHEVLGIIAAAATLLLGFALWSYDLRGGDNWVGPVGEAVAGFFVGAFGLGAVWLPVELMLATVGLFRLRATQAWVTHGASVLVILLLGCALLHLSLPELEVFGGHLAGGLLGEVLAEVLRSLVGPAGAYVLCIAALLINMVLRTSLSVVGLSHRVGGSIGDGARSATRSLRGGLERLSEAWEEAKAIEAEERAQAEAEGAPRIVDTAAGIDAAQQDEAGEDATEAEEVEPAEATEAEDDEGDDEGDDAAEELDDGLEAGSSATGRTVKLSENGGSKAACSGRARGGRKAGPVIVAPRSEPKRDAPVLGLEPRTTADGRVFTLPPTRLLSEPPENRLQIDADTLKLNASRLVEKLEAYGVKGRVDEIHPGPVVTMYEFEPASGTKISKIAGLSDDLAMALAAEKVRIVAPIPGKARVGFELPNERRQTVVLRELLEDERWLQQKGLLPVAFGKDIAGRSVYANLADMPHALVAGATGSGKSVGLNVMLTSLLMRKTPEELRLLMIDPKMVELAVFDGIPHMLLPVVTDMQKASLALRWAVDEMERRYQLFADAGARNIESYNRKVERVHSGDLSMDAFNAKRAGKARAFDHHGQEVLVDPDEGEQADANAQLPDKLPSIVVVVDEFADLMMVAAKDVEAAIARLAQKARAAGIHVILATQRPSVDVITGMIKANFPSRFAFKVSQREDSKTILGRNGAEHLLGKGDMLSLMPGASDLKRIHSAYIDEDEVKEVCDFLRLQGSPVYDENIIKPREEEEEGGLGGPASDDPLYDRAVAVVAQAGYCSISHIQRNLSIGYNKAAKLVERMEKEGVVGPASGKAGGRREVFVEAR